MNKPTTKLIIFDSSLSQKMLMGSNMDVTRVLTIKRCLESYSPRDLDLLYNYTSGYHDEHSELNDRVWVTAMAMATEIHGNLPVTEVSMPMEDNLNININPINDIDEKIAEIAWESVRMEKEMSNRSKTEAEDLFESYRVYITNGELNSAKNTMRRSIRKFSKEDLNTPKDHINVASEILVEANMDREELMNSPEEIIDATPITKQDVNELKRQMEQIQQMMQQLLSSQHDVRANLPTSVSILDDKETLSLLNNINHNITDLTDMSKVNTTIYETRWRDIPLKIRTNIISWLKRKTWGVTSLPFNFMRWAIVTQYYEPQKEFLQFVARPLRLLQGALLLFIHIGTALYIHSSPEPVNARIRKYVYPIGSNILQYITTPLIKTWDFSKSILYLFFAGLIHFLFVVIPTLSMTYATDGSKYALCMGQGSIMEYTKKTMPFGMGISQTAITDHYKTCQYPNVTQIQQDLYNSTPVT
jgi:hypothetical protein